MITKEQKTVIIDNNKTHESDTTNVDHQKAVERAYNWAH